MNGQDMQIEFAKLQEITRQSYEAFLAATEKALRGARPCGLAIDEEAAEEQHLELDLATFKAAPVLAVPKFGKFAPLMENGHRFLLAEGGLYLEARRPWLHFIHCVAPQAPDVRIPYGPLANSFELAFGRLGTTLQLLQEFAGYATSESPLEAAACLIWNHKTNLWAIKYPEIIGTATSGSISYKQVPLDEDESMVVDLHSHGAHSAFFSEQDNEDDSGSVKIAGVYGDLDKDQRTAAFRLCVLGVYLPIAVPAEKIFA